MHVGVIHRISDPEGFQEAEQKACEKCWCASHGGQDKGPRLDGTPLVAGVPALAAHVPRKVAHLLPLFVRQVADLVQPRQVRGPDGVVIFVLADMAGQDHQASNGYAHDRAYLLQCGGTGHDPVVQERAHCGVGNTRLLREGELRVAVVPEPLLHELYQGCGRAIRHFATDYTHQRNTRQGLLTIAPCPSGCAVCNVNDIAVTTLW
jgi:hypothetical protein